MLLNLDEALAGPGVVIALEVRTLQVALDEEGLAGAVLVHHPSDSWLEEDTGG